MSDKKTDTPAADGDPFKIRIVPDDETTELSDDDLDIAGGLKPAQCSRPSCTKGGCRTT